jgi:glucosamine-6-phosphate deaminase
MRIVVCDNPELLGQQAAAQAADLIRHSIAEHGWANVVFASGSSQAEMLSWLVKAPNIDWGRVTGFELAEYVGLDGAHPNSSRVFLTERLLRMLSGSLRHFHEIDPSRDCERECARLSAVISDHPITVAFLGIGEQGQVALNDPPADFHIRNPYMVVQLQEESRVEKAAERAISMSMQQILRAHRIIVCAPEARKAQAVKHMIEGPLTPNMPASLLQEHPSVTVYLDPASAALIRRSGTTALVQDLDAVTRD